METRMETLMETHMETRMETLNLSRMETLMETLMETHHMKTHTTTTCIAGSSRSLDIGTARGRGSVFTRGTGS